MDILTMFAEVSPCEEGAHGVPHDADGGVRPLLLGNLRDAVGTMRTLSGWLDAQIAAPTEDVAECG